ncbi:hypothetical protein [Parazoarcus communis]|jgi:hypothetical protein|uniref:hypothetical protein n=1 Tax=Parazoarcus communis TaxID=41977 RepID=UPI00131EFF49|nr:hypothetical protein [Parazoarcus communis]
MDLNQSKLNKGKRLPAAWAWCILAAWLAYSAALLGASMMDAPPGTACFTR